MKSIPGTNSLSLSLSVCRFYKGKSVYEFIINIRQFDLEFLYCFQWYVKNVNQIDLNWDFTVMIDVLYISITNWEKNIFDPYCRKWKSLNDTCRFFIRTKDPNRKQVIKIRITRTNKKDQMDQRNHRINRETIFLLQISI